MLKRTELNQQQLITEKKGFIRHIPFLLSLLIFLIVIYDLGFDQDASAENIIRNIYNIYLAAAVLFFLTRLFLTKHQYPGKVLIFDILILAFLLFIISNVYGLLHIPALDDVRWRYLAVFLVFIRELFTIDISTSGRYVNPAQLFILSFLAIIFTGTILLLLPNSTHSGISFTDALFTSTSAVCVTGLIVVDTGSYFTLFGQTIIMLLIQMGGLGIMTFTSYFSYFFKGGATYENQLLLGEIINAERIADVFSTLKRIIIVTFIIEAIGAVFIFSFLDKSIMPAFSEQFFFSIFHTVSGFCNAGFSTLTNSFYETGFRFNYPLHLTIAALFITGGIGFPILFNSFKYVRHFIVNRLTPFLRRKPVVHLPWVININTRLVVITSLVLIISGTAFFYIAEYNNTLADHKGFGKVVTAFFGAVTPRTAGFNTVDTSSLHFSTIMIIIFLMWVGASPASTGGGIKTSTLAISILNLASVARGKNRLELFRREIAGSSIQRAFAIISLSILMIGISVFLIASLEPDMDLMAITFECFSAFSTVGLSQGITGNLKEASKIVIIFTMFIGRVSMLTILVAVIKKVKNMNYRYPAEEVLIN
ncbi:MAG: potassium transporter TrkG [Bacteroidales bacterium]